MNRSDEESDEEDGWNFLMRTTLVCKWSSNFAKVFIFAKIPKGCVNLLEMIALVRGLQQCE